MAAVGRHSLERRGLTDGIGAYLGRNPGMSFVAIHGRTLVGIILCGHDGRRGYIHHLAVHPRFRRQGLGRRLVGHSVSALVRAGIQKCHLFAINDNGDGIAFWKRIGWSPRIDISVISKDLTEG